MGRTKPEIKVCVGMDVAKMSITPRRSAPNSFGPPSIRAAFSLNLYRETPRQSFRGAANLRPGVRSEASSGFWV